MTFGAALHNQSVAAFDPGELFKRTGADGFWYDPSDLSTLFTDAAGTTPVGANNDPVGFIRDKSGRGHNGTRGVDDTHRPTWVASTNGRPYFLFTRTSTTVGNMIDIANQGPIIRNTGFFTVVAGLNTTTLATGSNQNILLLSRDDSAGLGRLVVVFQDTGPFTFYTRRLNTDSLASISPFTAITAGVDAVVICEANYADQNGTIIQGNAINSNYGSFPPSAGTTPDVDSVEAVFGAGESSVSGTDAFGGRIYGIIAISRLLTLGEKLKMMRWMAMKTIGRYN